MDYSTVSNDIDQPGGTSPWASSSPRHNRTTFSHATSGSTSPSLPAANSSLASDETDSTTAANLVPPVSTDAAAATASPRLSKDDRPESPDLSAQLQSAQLGDPDYIGDHETNPYSHQQAQSYVPQQQRQVAARYSHSQTSHRPVTAYKLQAKITALERTGRKDPVLRFDVYVSMPAIFSIPTKSLLTIQ
jgi:hypothetical protein